MGGIFMKKLVKRTLICLLFAAVFWSVSLFADNVQLKNNLIRLHVVANSDSEEDQKIKIQVRDAVLSSIQQDLEMIADIETAKTYLQSNLATIQKVANDVLHTVGFEGKATVSLCKEKFSEREYDTFSLPAGVYESLRIVIGDGVGKNWWCVTFPALCLPATAEEFSDKAVGAGFSEDLTRTLVESEDYEIRFYFLNMLGKLENIFFPE